MDYIEVFVETSSQGLEGVCGVLYQAGLTGFIVQDPNDFLEFLQEKDRQWDYIEEGLEKEKKMDLYGVTFYLRNASPDQELFLDIKAQIARLPLLAPEIQWGKLSVTVKNVKEEDWADQWKQYFKPFPVGEKFLVKPSWEDVPADNHRTVLEIDPGNLFGTGLHETTRLCLSALEAVVPEQGRVLDIGCGSGILSIGALLLGANFADAVDIDPNGINVARDNAARNRLDPQKYCVLAGDILADADLQKRYGQTKYHLVTANIVADVILALTKLVPDFLLPQGIFLVSGLIDARVEEVKDALKEAGFLIKYHLEENGWHALTAQMK